MTDTSRASQSSEENEVTRTPSSEKKVTRTPSSEKEVTRTPSSENEVTLNPRSETEVTQTSLSENPDNYSESFESDAETEVTLPRKQRSVTKAAVKNTRHNHYKKMKQPPRLALKITPINDIEQTIISVRKLQNNELRNMNGDLMIQIEKQKEEIRLLKRMGFRQAKIIEKFDSNKSNLPNLIDSHNKELKVLREQLRIQKLRYRKSEESLRESDGELERTKNRLNKYKMLLDEEQLVDRAELSRKLGLAEQRLEETEKQIQNLQNHIEHLVKNHKHEINIEKNQNKKLKASLQSLEEKYGQIELQLLEKEKELEVWNIYSKRQKSNKLNSSFNTPRSNPSVKNKFNDKVPPLTPASLRMKKCEEGRKQKELKKTYEKPPMNSSSSDLNKGDKKNAQKMSNTNDLDAADTVLMSESNGYTNKPREVKKEGENKKKETRLMTEGDEQEQKITELIEQTETDSKHVEKKNKKTEINSVNDEVNNRSEKTKSREGMPKMSSDGLNEAFSEKEMAELKQKQDEERKRKDMLLAKLKEIDNNTEISLKSERMFSNDDILIKSDNKTHYSFSKKTENLHQGRPVNEHNPDRRNSPLILSKFSEKATPLETPKDLFTLKKKDNLLEDLFTSDLSLAPDKPLGESKGDSGNTEHTKWNQKPNGKKNKSDFFNELFEDPTENMTSDSEFFSFNHRNGDLNNIGSSEPTVWDVGSMLRNDNKNNENHSTKLLPSRQQMNRFEKRSTSDALDNSIDSVEEIIL